MDNNKMLLVINPVSGKNKAKEFAPDIIKRFEEAGYEVNTVYTLKEKNAYKIVIESGHDADLIVCVGGDGTLKETVGGVMDASLNKPIGYIPMGSTNDFARSIGIPRNDVMAAVDNIIEGTPYPVDIGRFENEKFIYVAAFGNFTAISYNTSQKLKNALGHSAYYIPAVKDFFKMKPYHAKVVADDEVFEGDYFYGATSNSYSIGGMPVLYNIGVKFDDGMHELILIKMFKNPKQMAQVISAMLRRDARDNDMIVYRHAKTIKFVFDKPTPFTLDGEFGGDRLVASTSTLKHAVKIILKEDFNLHCK